MTMEVMQDKFNLLIIHQSPEVLLGAPRVFIPYNGSHFAKKGDQVSHYYSHGHTMLSLRKCDSDWSIFREIDGVKNELLWTWKSESLDFPLNQSSEWTGTTNVALTFEFVSLHELHQPLSIDRYHLWNFLLHRLLNCRVSEKQIFTDWLAKVNQSDQLNGVDRLTKLCVESGTSFDLREVSGMMYYALFHNTNGEFMEASTKALICDSIPICLPVYLRHALTSSISQHTVNCLETMLSMVKLSPNAFGQTLHSDMGSVESFAALLKKIVDEPNSITFDRSKMLLIVKELCASVSSSGIAKENLAVALSPSYEYLSDSDISKYIQPFSIPNYSSVTTEYVKLGYWWTALQITEQEEEILESRIPSQCVYKCAISQSIMRVPALLTVSPTTSSVYEASHLQTWLSNCLGPNGLGRTADPRTGIMVAVNLASRHSLIRIDHVRLQEIRNWVTDELVSIRSPGILPAVQRKMTYLSKVVFTTENFVLLSLVAVLIAAMVVSYSNQQNYETPKVSSGDLHARLKKTCKLYPDPPVDGYFEKKALIDFETINTNRCDLYLDDKELDRWFRDKKALRKYKKETDTDLDGMVSWPEFIVQKRARRKWESQDIFSEVVVSECLDDHLENLRSYLSSSLKESKFQSKWSFVENNLRFCFSKCDNSGSCNMGALSACIEKLYDGIDSKILMGEKRTPRLDCLKLE